MIMKLNSIALTCVACFGSFAGTANGDLLAYWNFNTEPTDPGSIPALVGNGTIDTTGYGGDVFNVFGGDSLNSLFGDPAGTALSLHAGGGGIPGNDTWVDFNFATTGYESPVLSFAYRGGTTTFTNVTWSWSTDGVNFTEIDGLNTASTEDTQWVLRTVDLTGVSALTDEAAVTLRMMVAGSPSGTSQPRFDNIQINAVAVPAPGALGLLCVAGFVVRRRRR